MFWRTIQCFIELELLGKNFQLKVIQNVNDMKLLLFWIDILNPNYYYIILLENNFLKIYIYGVSCLIYPPRNYRVVFIFPTIA